jgi:hypothetical protein
MLLAFTVTRQFDGKNPPYTFPQQNANSNRPTRITGYKSGLKAAGQECVFGIYDGVTGLVVQPYTGARDYGMGLTGFVLKDLAAIFGPFGYTLKGVHKEPLKHKQPTHFIRKAQIIQGQRDAIELDTSEKKKVNEAVSHGWSVVLQVWDIMEEKRTHCLKGRIHFLRERKMWRANGAFENVWMAEKALEARRKGESLEGVFSQQREELQLAKRPRKNVNQDIGQGLGNENDDGRQKVTLRGSAEPAGKEMRKLVP